MANAWAVFADRAPAPPRIQGMAPDAFDDIPEPDGVTLDSLDGLALEGITVGVLYTDSSGATTQRRIMMKKFTVSRSGNLLLRAHCLERDATRSFRFDRISAIYPMQGGLDRSMSARDFFGDELGVIIPIEALAIEDTFVDERSGIPSAVKAVRDTAPEVLARLRQFCRDELVILTGMSRADRVMRREEIDVIVSHALDRAAEKGIEVTKDLVTRLDKYIRNLRPSAGRFLEATYAISKSEVFRQKELMRSCIKVMDADGVQHPAEVDLVLSLKEDLSL